MLLALLDDEADRALVLEFYTRYERKLHAAELNILKSETLTEDAAQNAKLQIIRHFEDFKKFIEKAVMKLSAGALL